MFFLANKASTYPYGKRLRVVSVEIKTTTVNKQKQESTGVPAVRECPKKPAASAKPIEAVSRLSFFTHVIVPLLIASMSLKQLRKLMCFMTLCLFPTVLAAVASPLAAKT